MRIATWNVNGLRARLDFVAHWLNARKPDIVGFQELKLEDDKFPHDAFAELGYKVVTHAERAWNGVAVVSRETPEVVQRGLPDQGDFGARLITAKAGGITFTTVYVPNGKTVEHPDFPRKLAWLDALTAHFSGVAQSAQAVLCGDFNLCPAPIDSWNEARLAGKIFHTVEERSRFQALLGKGFVDLFRAAHPDTQAFSWWDYRGGAFHRKQGLRIDLLLGTKDVFERVRSIEIDREYRKKQDGLTASDHAPVIADLD